MSKKNQVFIGFLLMFLLIPRSVSAMHIMEGFLQPKWCIAWGVITIPFIIVNYQFYHPFLNYNFNTYYSIKINYRYFTIIKIKFQKKKINRC